MSVQRSIPKRNNNFQQQIKEKQRNLKYLLVDAQFLKEQIENRNTLFNSIIRSFEKSAAMLTISHVGHIDVRTEILYNKHHLTAMHVLTCASSLYLHQTSNLSTKTCQLFRFSIRQLISHQTKQQVISPSITLKTDSFSSSAFLYLPIIV